MGVALSRVLISTEAAVASEQPLASLAGYEALKKGGNAVDAAVATAFALSVLHQPAGGIGGDFFALVFESSTGRIHCLNSSGWAPSGLKPELFKEEGRVPLFGPRSVVVPGFVAGVHSMHKRFGKLDFKRLLSAPIRYASEGFPASEGFCRSTRANYDNLTTSARAVFAPAGRPPIPGDWIVQRKLARLIREVAEGGPELFYRGWPAEKIRAELAMGGVHASEADFDFRPEWVEPLKLDYGRLTVYEFPPNSMGATSLLILKLMSEKKLSTKPNSNERVRATVEAARFAYERRDEMLGDPRFGSIDIDVFLDAKHARSQARSRVLGEGDTTAFSVVDGEGNIVSAIQSLYHHYGSRVFVEECGIVLNNRGAGFSLKGPNAVQPRKRPLHTLSTMLLSVGCGSPSISVGCSGGDYRPVQHALLVTNIADYGMSLEDAIDFPRFLWSGGNHVLAEEGYEDLSNLPYEVEKLGYPGRTGVAQGVETMGRARKGVCDVRGDGIPYGF